MGVIEDIYEDLDADVSLEEFREAVEAKVEQMGGLADEETAAQLIVHDLQDGEVETIADIEAGMEEVRFVGKVLSVGELRTFERDGEDGEGQVLNLELADETGRVRVALWDEDAAAAEEELETGMVLRVAGRPKDGYNGLEVSANRVEGDEETEIDVDLAEGSTVESLSLGQSDVNLRGVVLDTGSVRTFSRDDGSEGRVSNLTLGDETGRVRVTMWDERADRAEELDPGTTVEVVDGYVREREGNLELHVGSRGAVEEIDEAVTFVPEATDIGSLEIGQTVDIAGVIRSADPKRTFDRDDGSEGQVRNVRVTDETGDVRVALWGEKADRDLGPGDEVFLADVEIQDGWQDDIEASAGFRSTIVKLDGTTAKPPERDGAEGGSGNQHGGGGSGSEGGSDGGGASSAETGLDAFAGGDGSSESGSGSEAAGAELEAKPEGEESGGVEAFTGTVVQTGDPVMLDDGEETRIVETEVTVELGQEVTVRGRRDGDRIEAEDVELP
ncbi:single-stranded DNA binding protein [Salinirubellus sp. GCM10025818]|uniref:single-stranded DNA binding protein n=1 Tax=Salinirubellus TaxID=2162630 RepID=UPI0030D4943A